MGVAVGELAGKRGEVVRFLVAAGGRVGGDVALACLAEIHSFGQPKDFWDSASFHPAREEDASSRP